VSRSSLKEISFRVDFLEEDEEVDRNLSAILMPAVLYLFRKIQNFPSVKTVRFRTPNYLSLQAGNDQPGSKRADLCNYAGGALQNGRRGDGPAICELIQSITNFIPGGFTEVLIPGDHNDFKIAGSQILQELSDSRENLRSLELFCLSYRNRKMMWDLIISCPNLNSLSLFLLRDEMTEELEIPKGMEKRKISLRKLYFLVVNPSAPWNRFLEWIGNELEDVTLSNGGIVSRVKGTGFLTSNFLRSVLFNSTEH